MSFRWIFSVLCTDGACSATNPHSSQQEMFVSGKIGKDITKVQHCDIYCVVRKDGSNIIALQRSEFSEIHHGF